MEMQLMQSIGNAVTSFNWIIC